MYMSVIVRPFHDSFSPPWEVLVLVSHYLDPKTLAIASCVCKSWFVSMSSDHLWKPICATHFPSLSNLKLTIPNPAANVPSFHRLYAIGRAAAKRRLQTPSKPRLTLDHLIFAVNIFSTNSLNVFFALERPGAELVVDPNGIFKFDIDVDDYEVLKVMGDWEKVRVTWHVVLKGWRGVFSMMDCEEKGVEGWFSEELPSPPGSVVASGIVADLKLGFCNNRRMKKVSVGMLSIINWRYVSVDDALRYLQHFLLPCVV